MEHSSQEQEVEGSGRPGPGLQAEVLRSYAAFALRALSSRKSWVAGLFAAGVLLTMLVIRYIPRTYSCTTVLMAMSNPVLDQNNGSNPLAGAPTLIMRQENLETIVRETNLVQKTEERRPPLLKLKDLAMQALFGRWSPDTLSAIAVGTLQSKLSVGSDSAGNLTINADWSDGKTAAEIAEAAREGFLRSRHAAEISAFEAKMAILDEHASKLRSEVETLAQQINAAHEERAAQVTKAVGAPAPAPVAAGDAAPRVVVRRAAPATPDLSLSAQLPEQRAKLEELKHRLTEAENERDRRIREEQAKLAEMRLHLTPSHPQVVTEQERLAMLAQVPSDVALLRSEVADLTSTVKSREALVAHGSGSVAGGPALSGQTNTASQAALPAEIIQALENDNTDPALTAQISGAVVRYGSLRDEMRGGRMELDTAQAAFDHRYQIVVPAAVPNVPTKPKMLTIFGGGLALSILLALLLPILAELRRGIIIERWQVQMMHLPVLAELKLPPHSVD